MAEEKTVLIVDDEEKIREMLKEYILVFLVRKGFPVNVLLAENPNQAARMINENSVDLAITDINMGQFSGWDVINFASRLINPPILAAMTGDQNNIEGLKEKGIYYFEKPFFCAGVCDWIKERLFGEKSIGA